LEDEHLVTSSIHTEGARPPKKMFSITEAGRKTFKNWMMKPVKHGREIRINLLIKFYFAERKDAFQADQIIDSQILECNRWLDFLIRSPQNRPENDQFRFLVEQFRKSQIEGYISWLHWCKGRKKDD
jgi:DNA-binding PadR family transcriptional regulator